MRAIIGVAQSMDIVVVAEGVESSEQVELLSALGRAAAQGSYYHPPLSADRCRPLLEQLAAVAPVALGANGQPERHVSAGLSAEMPLQAGYSAHGRSRSR